MYTVVCKQIQWLAVQCATLHYIFEQVTYQMLPNIHTDTRALLLLFSVFFLVVINDVIFHITFLHFSIILLK